MNVISTAPPSDTLVEACDEQPDHRDNFRAEVDDDVDVDSFARAYFLAQSRPLALISTRVLGRRRMVQTIESIAFDVGTSVGSWQVIDRDDREIVFGENMGFMEYRVSFRVSDPGRADASTTVQHRIRSLGRAYWWLIAPMHRRFLSSTVSRAVSRLASHAF